MKQSVAKKRTSVKESPKYESSPFLNTLTVSTRGRKVTVARGSALVNVKTGEFEGVTEIAQVVEVDEGNFVKLFTKDLANWFDLNKSAMRVFGALLTVIQKSSIGKDMVFFDVRDDSLKIFKISKTTFYRGLNELIEKGFIARHISPGWFFINPAMFFNGNRARFIKEYRVNSLNKFTEKENIEDKEITLNKKNLINETDRVLSRTDVPFGEAADVPDSPSQSPSAPSKPEAPQD